MGNTTALENIVTAILIFVLHPEKSSNMQDEGH